MTGPPETRPPDGTPPAPGDGLAGAVLRALQATADFRSLTNPELEAAVREYAAAAHAAGVTPERMLVSLATMIAGGTPASTGAWWYAVLRDRLIVWAIEGYYTIDVGRRSRPTDVGRSD